MTPHRHRQAGKRTFLGTGCVSYLQDGRPMDPSFWVSIWEDCLLGWIHGRDVVAVEYYRNFEEVPPELRSFADDDGDYLCGMVVFSTPVGW